MRGRVDDGGDMDLAVSNAQWVIDFQGGSGVERSVQDALGMGKRSPDEFAVVELSDRAVWWVQLYHHVIIDGYSQPGASPNTLALGNDAVIRIVIDGGSVASAVNTDSGFQMPTAAARHHQPSRVGQMVRWGRSRSTARGPHCS